MHVITADQLRRAAPGCLQPDQWVRPLNDAMLWSGIADDLDYMVEFLAQCAHETTQFNVLEECLNYTAERLVAVWPSRFPSITVAAQYARAPHKLADFIYGGRFGNPPGDGWTYRGRGMPMVTFHDNYAKVAKRLNLPALLKCPDILQTKATATMAGAAFWVDHPQLNRLADDTATDDDYADFVTITRVVNGGTVGLADRAKLRTAFKAALL